MPVRLCTLAALAALLAACSSPVPLTSKEPASSVVRLECEGRVPVIARFGADSVQIEGLPQGPELLLRDAGGTSPQQSVFSSSRLRAEFGLGEGGRQVLLQPLQVPASPVHCLRL